MGAPEAVSRRGKPAIKDGVVRSLADVLLLVGAVALAAGVAAPTALRVDAPFVLYASWARQQALLLRADARGGENLDQIKFAVIDTALRDALWLARVLNVPLEVLMEDGTERSPKFREKRAEDLRTAAEAFLTLEGQRKRGRSNSISNKALARALQGVAFFTGHEKARILEAVLGNRGGVKLVHDADASFWLYGPGAPVLQLLLTGTRGRQGDFDAVLQLAVAHDGVLLLCILQACSTSEMVRVADACAVRRTVIESFLALFSKRRDTKDYSRPFAAAKDQLSWLAAQFVTSCHGAQDYAQAVKVTREGVEDKTLWMKTLCTALDHWLVSKHLAPQLTLDQFMDALPDVARGMLLEQTKERSFGDFRERLRVSLLRAGLATIELTRQGPDAVACWRRFCNSNIAALHFGSFDALPIVAPSVANGLVKNAIKRLSGRLQSSINHVKETRADAKEQARRDAAAAGLVDLDAPELPQAAPAAVRPAFARGKAFPMPVVDANAYSALSEQAPEKPKKKKTKKSLGLPTKKRADDAAPAVLKSKYKRAKANEEEEEDDNDLEMKDIEKLEKRLKTREYHKAAAKSKAKRTTDIRSVHMGSLTGACSSSPDVAVYLKVLLSDEPALVSRFLLTCAPLFGEVGLPILAAAFWDSVAHDAGALMRGGAGTKIKWMGERAGTRLRLEFSDSKAGKEGPVVFFDEEKELALAKIRDAMLSARATFSKEEQATLQVVFDESQDAFHERWGKSIASAIRTPLAANLERLLYGIVNAAVTDCFAAVATRKMNADEAQAFVALRAQWATPEATEALLFNEGKLQDLSKLVSPHGASTASLAEVVSKCIAAIKGLEFHFQPGDRLDKTPTTVKAMFAGRDSCNVTFGSVRALMTRLSELWRDFCPKWGGYALYPEIRKRWRCLTSSNELKKGVHFGCLRAAFRLASDKNSVFSQDLDGALQYVRASGEGKKAQWTRKDGLLMWCDLLKLAGATKDEKQAAWGDIIVQ